MTNSASTMEAMTAKRSLNRTQPILSSVENADRTSEGRLICIFCKALSFQKDFVDKSALTVHVMKKHFLCVKNELVRKGPKPSVVSTFSNGSSLSSLAVTDKPPMSTSPGIPVITEPTLSSVLSTAFQEAPSLSTVESINSMLENSTTQGNHMVSKKEPRKLPAKKPYLNPRSSKANSKLIEFMKKVQSTPEAPRVITSNGHKDTAAVHSFPNNVQSIGRRKGQQSLKRRVVKSTANSHAVSTNDRISAEDIMPSSQHRDDNGSDDGNDFGFGDDDGDFSGHDFCSQIKLEPSTSEQDDISAQVDEQVLATSEHDDTSAQADEQVLARSRMLNSYVKLELCQSSLTSTSPTKSSETSVAESAVSNIKQEPCSLVENSLDTTLDDTVMKAESDVTDKSDSALDASSAAEQDGGTDSSAQATDESQHPCLFCNKSFKSLTLLELHTKALHLNENDAVSKLQCFDCGITFSRKKELTEHKRVHKSGMLY